MQGKSAMQAKPPNEPECLTSRKSKNNKTASRTNTSSRLGRFAAKLCRRTYLMCMCYVREMTCMTSMNRYAPNTQTKTTTHAQAARQPQHGAPHTRILFFAEVVVDRVELATHLEQDSFSSNTIRPKRKRKQKRS